MKLEIKTFDELTTRELYEILRLRSQIFVVEQRSIYQDLDSVDYDSAHLMLWNEIASTHTCAFTRSKAIRGTSGSSGAS